MNNVNRIVRDRCGSFLTASYGTTGLRALHPRAQNICDEDCGRIQNLFFRLRMQRQLFGKLLLPNRLFRTGRCMKFFHRGANVSMLLQHLLI